jgi:hypothetical protein
MKLLRWAMAGATVYVVYRYSIGKARPGEEVFKSPADFSSQDRGPATAAGRSRS